MRGPEQDINYHGRDWQLLELYLQELKEKKIGLLITAATHDQSNQVRGALSIISQLLALKEAAVRAANQG